MAVPTGRYRLGTESGRIVLHTFRDGLAATAGHDLVVDLPRWSGELTVDDDKMPTALEARIDIGALAVREGTGGLKPLTDRDRREIATTARRLLASDQHPEAVFTSTRFELTGDSGVIEGNLSIRGVSRPFRLQVTQSEPGRYRGTGTVVQSAYGMKPYTAFFGALKVRDAVDIEVQATVPAPGDDGE
ncbi:MAG TPA: YceI family protein [Streptosporangiaceae bacterium]|nr:YceI family protein [Streptosporangiaceae bacterium]